MTTTARHIIFTGRVQGVGFRYTVQRIALRYDLTGFVKNLPNGTVEMLAQGRPEAISPCLQDIAESFGTYIKDTQIEDAPLAEHKQFKIAF